MNQKGFATLEVILMVVVLGILATVAVPRFTDITTKANTAKVQADMATINSASAVYEMEKGSTPANVAALVSAGYLQAEPPAPTSGKIYLLTGETYDLKSTSKYEIKDGEVMLDDTHKASAIGKKPSKT